MTNIVQSIRFLSVKSHVPSSDAVPLRLWKLKFLRRSRICSLFRDWSRLQFLDYGTQVPVRCFESSPRRLIMALRSIGDDPHRAIPQHGIGGVEINHQLA